VKIEIQITSVIDTLTTTTTTRTFRRTKKRTNNMKFDYYLHLVFKKYYSIYKKHYYLGKYF